MSDPAVDAEVREARETRRAVLERLGNIETQLAKLVGAFPAGDTDGHRRAHEAMIERTAELRRLRVAITEKTISGLLWAGLVFCGLAVWEYIKRSAK